MSAPLPTWPYSRHIAHRGGGRLAPENTLAAMRVGAEHGFTMFEYDVKLSRDNVLVLMHDDDVDRTSNGHGPAAAKTFSELAQLDFGSWPLSSYDYLALRYIKRKLSPLKWIFAGFIGFQSATMPGMP